MRLFWRCSELSYRGCPSLFVILDYGFYIQVNRASVNPVRTFVKMHNIFYGSGKILRHQLIVRETREYSFLSHKDLTGPSTSYFSLL